ncbi:MAG: stage sporulation protein [Thermotogaceae bacterium]|nr:stage sporulation protein [Thermotogaceae bacterium]
MRRFKVIFLIFSFLTVSFFAFDVKIGLSQNNGPFKNAKELIIEAKDLMINDELKLHDKIKIRFSDGKLLVFQNEKTIYRGIYIKISTNSNNLKITRTDNNYSMKLPGYLILFPSNYIQIINVLDIETYVSLVIPYEIGNAPFEAIKAQAVISRTYTLRNLGRHSDEGFDLCSTVHCQVYKGIPAVNITKYVNATHETFGETLLYNGKLIDPVFSSNNGGVIASASEVWRGDYPYILPLNDVDENGIPYGAFSNSYSWIAEIPRLELFRKLSENPAYSPGAYISSIEVLERGPSGRVTKIKIKGENDIEMTGNTFRFLAGLRSTLFDLEYVPSTDKFIFKGRGWGHGVGLSQWGAIDMASRGKKYTDILHHYFRGSYLNGGLRVIVNNFDSIKDIEVALYIDGKKYPVKKFETIIPNIPAGFHEIKLSSSNVMFKDIVKKVFVRDEKGTTVQFDLDISKKSPVMLEKVDTVLTSKDSVNLKLTFLDSNRIEVPYRGKIRFVSESGTTKVFKIENSLKSFQIELNLKEGENLFKVIPDEPLNPVWLKVVKNTSSPIEPEVSFENVSKGIGIKILNLNKDILKTIIYRKSSINEDWIKLVELGEKDDYFFDIAVDDFGDYIYGISFVNRFGSESSKTIISISRNFVPPEITVEGPKIVPKRMPNLPEKYIDVKSLFENELYYIDLDSSINIELSDDEKVLGKSIRVIPAKDSLKVVDKDKFTTTSTGPQIILKGEKNMPIKVKTSSANQLQILAENNGQTIKIIFYEKLRDYIARQLKNFCFETDPLELEKLKAVILRTNVVYSLLTGRYKTDYYDLPYELDYFKIGGNIDLVEAYRLVDETENLVITIGNKVVDGVFVVDNGGCMAKDSERWYLADSAGIKTDETLWTKQYSSEDLGELIKEYFIDLGDITNIEIISKDKYGRVSHIRLTGEKGILNIYGEDSIRYALKLEGSIFEIINPGNIFIFKGKAFGNCEGISLKDATSLAKNGVDYQQIIRKYYTNSRVTSFQGLSAMLFYETKEEYLFSEFDESNFEMVSSNSQIDLSNVEEGIKLTYTLFENGIAGIGTEILFLNPFKALELELKGDLSDNFIRLKFVDSQGEVFLTPPVRISWDNIDKISFETEKLVYQTWNNVEVNKNPDFPMILKEIYLVYSKNSIKRSGEIILKRLKIQN